MHCRAGACPRRYLPGYPPGGHAAFRRFFEGGFAGFLSEAPPAPPTRRAPPFLPEEMGRKKGRRAFRLFKKDASHRFTSKAPPAPSTPAPPVRGAHGGGGLYVQGRDQACIAARFVGTSCGSLASPQAAKLVPSTVPPLPTEPASLGFGGGPVMIISPGAAAPWVARIGVTLQALRAAALYRLGPPGRHWCHASEIPRHSRRLGNSASGMPRPTPPG